MNEAEWDEVVDRVRRKADEGRASVRRMRNDMVVRMRSGGGEKGRYDLV